MIEHYKPGQIVKFSLGDDTCSKCGNNEFYYLGKEDKIKGGKIKRRRKLKCSKCGYVHYRLAPFSEPK